MRPEILVADNFTPPTRTPWGGRKIATLYKPFVGADRDVIGESWEVSVEPSFPSRVARDGRLLSEVISEAPEAWLGAAVSERYGRQTPLLVKLLDTDDNLSVQVHPSMDDPLLAGDESGKPESWIVLDAEPGCGIYLGFREGVGRSEVEACLRDRGPLDALLNFVIVKPGDAFVIRAGTVHAIGRGVTMIEPQHVAPGRRGLTYRFWDWNRLYDPEGHRSPEGQPRELHIARSLAVTDWDAPGGMAFVDGCRSVPTLLSGGPLLRTRILRTPYFEAERWQGSGEGRFDGGGTMTAITCVSGHVEIETRMGSVALDKGRSAVVPAAAGDMTVRGASTDVFASRTLVQDLARSSL